MNATTGGSAVMRTVGFICFGIGALVIVGMRGCVSLSRRGAHSAYAKYLKAQSDFRAKWEEERQDLEADQRRYSEQISELRDKMIGRNGAKTPSPDERKRLDEEIKSLNEKLSEVRKKLSDIGKDEAKDKADLQTGKWRKLQRDATTSGFNVMTTEYFTQWFILPAAVVMFIGLILLAKFGTNAETLISLVIIGVIVYSLFVGGELWADSILDSGQRFGGRRL